MPESRAARIALKITKIIGFIVLSLISLFVLLALVIQLRPVQNFIVDKATHFISDKTKTRVEIGNIHIWFPNAIILHDVFLEDKSHDTLLQAGQLRINIDMFGLLRSRIGLSEIYIENFNSHIYRLPNDSAFNFSFIAEAFSDSTKSKDTTAGPLDLTIGKVKLKNFAARYDDDLTGNYANVRVGYLDLDISEFLINDNRYHVKSVDLDDSRITFTQTKISPPSRDSVSTLPFVGLDEINFDNVSIAYSHKAQEFDVSGAFNDLQVLAHNIDLPNQTLHLKKIKLNESTFAVAMPKVESAVETSADAYEDPKPWHVKIDQLVMNDDNASFDFINVAAVEKGFDPNHIDISNLTVEVNDFSYDGNAISALVRRAAFTDDKGFALKSFTGNLNYSDKGASITDFDLQTKRSRIGNTLEITYASFDSLANNLSDATVNVKLDNSKLSAEDLYYFVPSYREKITPNGNDLVVDVSTTIHGKVDDLHIDRFVLNTPKSTHININGIIRGLPEAENAYYDLALNNITVTRHDAMVLLPPDALPENITLPISSTLKGYFKGSFNLFDTRVALNTTSGDMNASVNMNQRTSDTTYIAKAEVNSLDLAYLLSDTTLGPVTLTANVKGRGMSRATVDAEINAVVKEAVYKKYPYQNLDIDGRLADQMFKGTAVMNDSNLAFAFDGLVSFEPDSERYAFTLDMKGVDLYATHLSEQQLRLSFKSKVDLKGTNANNLNGDANLTELLVIKGERNYRMDSVFFASINKEKKNSMSFKSNIITASYTGTMAISDVANALKHHINRYFHIADTTDTPHDSARFEFSARINNSPIINEVLVPGLGDFMPLEVDVKFNSSTNSLSCDVQAPHIEYKKTLLDSFQFHMQSNAEELTYKLEMRQIVSTPMRIAHTIWDGRMKNNELRSTLSIRDKRDTTRLLLSNSLKRTSDGFYRLSIIPDGLILYEQQWKVPEDNFIQFGGENLWVHNLKLTSQQQSFTAQTAGDVASGDLQLSFDNFDLGTLSRIAEEDSVLVRGKLNGNTTLRLGEPSFAFTADLKLDSVSYRKTPVGSVTVKGNTLHNNTYSVNMRLFDYGNDTEVSGTYTASDNPSMNITADLRHLNMQTISALSNGEIENANGFMNGKVLLTGSTTEPKFNGNLKFNNASFIVRYLNNYVLLENELVEFRNQELVFSNFTLRDTANHTAIFNGDVSFANLSNILFNLDITTDQFRVINTNNTHSKLFYGTILLDSRIRLRGNQNLPRVEAIVKIHEGSSFTVGIPEEVITTDRGEGVVKFTDPKGLLSPIMTRELIDTVQQTDIKGFDISASIDINRKSTFTLITDNESGDSLVVHGDASMAFGLDPSGKMSLTGAYAVNDGSYRLSVKSIVKRDIEIVSGSTITWSGSPTQAEMDMRAIYRVRAAPIDLMANELVALSQAEVNQYKQKIPLEVLVNIRGLILSPDISFTIELRAEDRAALGGTVNAKLMRLNEDLSSLNKQVFALLVLNRFVQDNPLSSSGDGGTESFARQSISKFLSQQLNRLSENYVRMVDVTVDLQSYNDYSSGESEGRTEMGLQISKKLFDERLIVKFGGSVDLEGERLNQNAWSDIAGDVQLEYALTKDSRYRLKAYQQKQYGGLLEGEISERGVGLIFSRDFDKWSQLFTKPKQEESVVGELKPVNP